MIMNTGVTVDVESDLYKKAVELCKDIEVHYDKQFTIPFPKQEVDTGCGKSKCDALMMEVSYRKAGRSLYCGTTYPSCYYLSIVPVELTPHGYTCLMFGGGNCIINECNRNTAKQQGLAAKAVQNELVDIVYKAFIKFGVKF